MERYLHKKASIDLASIVLRILGFDSVGPGRELEAKSLWGQKVVHIFNGVAAAAAAVQVLRK